MEAKEQTEASIAKRAVQSRAGRIAIKAVGWVVAIPALCALVVIGGAAPIYLLLPDAAPVAEDAASPAAIQTASTVSTAPPGSTPAAAKPSAAAPAEEPSSAAVSDAAETVDAAPPAEEVAEASLPEDTADDPQPEDAADASPPEEEAQEAQTVTVVPTARPRQEVVDAPASAAKAREMAALQPASREKPAAAPETKKPQQASRPTKRYVTIRPVALRSGPGVGREVAMLGRGAEVLAGACADWCEVSVGGVKGWIHPSFLRTSAPRERARRAAPRTINPYDDEPLVREEARRYDRRREAAPDWFLDEDRPIEIYDYDGRR